MKEAIPLYLRVLELQPDDANAREKLATGFILTSIAEAYLVVNPACYARELSLHVPRSRCVRGMSTVSKPFESVVIATP